MENAKEDLAISKIVGDKPIWCGVIPTPNEKYSGFAQIRAHGSPLACIYWQTGAEIHVELAEPLFGLATGQGLVIYDGDRVVGSATVSATE